MKLRAVYERLGLKAVSSQDKNTVIKILFFIIPRIFTSSKTKKPIWSHESMVDTLSAWSKAKH
jgi:hypothetical protein